MRDFTGLRDGPVKGHWVHIQPLEGTVLPSSQDKEASQHTIFVKTEVYILNYIYICALFNLRHGFREQHHVGVITNSIITFFHNVLGYG